jgi:oligopeptide transport system ATP-binding protein
VTPLLDVSDLEVRFDTPDGTVHAVNGVSFSLGKGETLAVVGESGSGKSVTMLALLRLLAEPPARIAGGTAVFNSSTGPISLLELGPRALRKVRGREIGYVAQDPMTSLNPTVTVETQLVETIRAHLPETRRSARRHAIELLGHVGIPDPARRVGDYPHQFSGGMRQRVMIAIAISCGPRVVIADEPTTALDVTVQAQIVELMVSLRDELELSMIWITHDLGVVAGLADRVAVMYGGRIVESAPVAELYGRPLHPYTIGLLGALPRLGERRDRLTAIPGVPPDLTARPAECAFAPRCPNAFDACVSASPPLTVPTNGRLLACFHDVENGVARG